MRPSHEWAGRKAARAEKTEQQVEEIKRRSFEKIVWDEEGGSTKNGTFAGRPLTVMQIEERGPWTAYLDGVLVPGTFWEVEHLQTKLIQMAAKARVTAKHATIAAKLQQAEYLREVEKRVLVEAEDNPDWGSF